MLPLNADVLVDHVFPYLELEDLENLGKTCREFYQLTNSESTWHDLYKRTFGVQPNALTAHKWPELYKLRSLASLYTWGGAGNGRLGYPVSEISKEDLAASGNATGCCRPKRVDRLGKKVIADLVAGGFSFTILTAKGELYGIGDVYQGGFTMRPIAVPIRRAQPAPLENRTDNTGHNNVLGHQGNVPITGMPGIAIPRFLNPRHPRTPVPPAAPRTPRATHHMQSMSISEALESKELRPSKSYVSVSSGRRHVVALTGDGDVFVWAQTFGLPGREVSFDFSKPANFEADNTSDTHEEKNSTRPKHSVLRVVAGWSCTVALVSGIGLIAWHADQHADAQLPDTQEEGYLRSGTQTQAPKEVVYSVVRNTDFAADCDEAIVDIVVGESFMVFLNGRGQVFQVSLRDLSSQGVCTLVPELLQDIESVVQMESGDRSKIRKLTGSFRQFAAFTSLDNVIMAHWENDKFSYCLHPELQQVGCVSVAMGDHHKIALLRGGRLLTWGTEPGSCGCLGQGQAEENLSSPGWRKHNYDLILDTPKPVSTPAKRALVIAAAGWQSAAIYAED